MVLANSWAVKQFVISIKKQPRWVFGFGVGSPDPGAEGGDGEEGESCTCNVSDDWLEHVVCVSVRSPQVTVIAAMGEECAVATKVLASK